MLGVVLAFIPFVVTLTAILGLRMKTHKAGLLGTACTWVIAILYSKTPITLLIYSWIYGILVPLSYTLAGFAAWFMTYHMMYHGCFEDIQESIKRMKGGLVYKVFFLCFGLGVMMLSSGAGFTWLAVVLNDMGISPWAVSILIEGSADPLTQYAYYATPVVVPTLLFGEMFGQAEICQCALSKHCYRCGYCHIHCQCEEGPTPTVKFWLIEKHGKIAPRNLGDLLIGGKKFESLVDYAEAYMALVRAEQYDTEKVLLIQHGAFDTLLSFVYGKDIFKEVDRLLDAPKSR